MKLVVPTAVILVTASLVALTTAACSSSTSSTPAGGGTAATLPDGGSASNVALTPGANAQAFEVRLATAECAWQQRCGPESFLGYYADVADCVAHASKTYAGSVHASSTAITDAQVTSCTAAWSSQSCTNYVQSAVCDFKGTVENGAACSYAAQCKSGSCFAATAAACGVCQDHAALGGDCSVAYCDARTTFCGSTKKCEALPKEGESCAVSFRCDGTLQCDPFSMKCANAKPAPLGGDCSDATGVSCDDTLDCIDDKCVAQTTAALGAACGVDDAGRTTNCLQSQCTGTDDNGANGKCTAWPAIGGACDNAKFIFCDLTATCLAGTCQLRGDLRVCK